MKRMKLTALILSLIILIFAFSSCHRVPPEDLALPDEDCVMVYTISENECIRILYDHDSQFHYYGEWIKGEAVTAVQFYRQPIHSTAGPVGLEVYIDIFYPDEEIHVCSSECNHTWVFDKGALNSKNISNPKTGETLPIKYSAESDLNFYFSWVSQTWIDFITPNGGIYKEETQNFWYDFQTQKGEWMINGRTVPIRMDFVITPKEITLHIYDISKETESHILAVNGKLIDENTFIGTEISGTMFYEGTVTEIKIVKTNSEP